MPAYYIKGSAWLKRYKSEIVILPLFHTLVQESIDLLPQYPLRTADALQFATALRASRAVAIADQPFHVVSTDKEIVAACVSHGIPHLDPESSSATSQLRALR